jgi:hypothetical protein
VLSAGPHTPRGEAPVTKGPSPSGYAELHRGCIAFNGNTIAAQNLVVIKRQVDKGRVMPARRRR